jgi:glycerol-3-phosphate O-acyltransferase
MSSERANEPPPQPKPARRGPGDTLTSGRHAAYEPNAILRWLYRRFFSHIHVDDTWSAAVRDAARRGVVVYVMRSISVLDFLCLDWLVKQLGMPLVRFVNDLGLWILEPFGKGERRLRLRRQIPEEKALKSVVRAEASALLFLRKPPGLGRDARKGERIDVDLIRTLVEAQRDLERPILLLPQTFVWSKLPPKKQRSIVDLLFGPTEWPGQIRVFFQFLFNYRNALLRTGEPFDLKAFLDANQDLTDGEAADKVRYALLRRIERERTIVIGPSAKTPYRIREEILRSPRVRKHIESAARASKKSVAATTREADAELRRLCAAPDPTVVGLFHRVLDWIWNRIYDGLVVDKVGLERVRAAARTGNLVLVPSHKSHVDYLVLSDVFYSHALSTPLIAAGDNLGFWPIGPIFRRGGAFFIKRSFKGKKLYSALVDAYIRKVMVEGFSIELFVEGGRSRTGKLLPPKLGLLSMIVDAALELRQRPTYFVPISVGYERIIEERAYVHELGGGEKEKENVGGLLNSSKVLRSRYGRLYIQFGEIIRFDDVVREVTGGDSDPQAPGRALTPPQRRTLVQRIAHQITHEIDRVTVATPAALVATALLTNRHRGIMEVDLVAEARTVLASLERLGAPLAPSILDESGQLREEAVRETIRLFLDGKLIVAHAPDASPGAGPIYGVPEERRIALEYYKNNILHFFVPNALIAAALRGSEAGPVSEDALKERVRTLSRLFKYEFMYRADAPFDAIFEDAIQGLVAAGELEREHGQVRTANGPGGARIAVYAELLRTYFESYRVALRGAELLVEAPLARKDWLKRTLAIGQRMYLAGEIERRESISRPKLETAIQALRDHGVIALGELDMLKPGDEAGSLAEIRAFSERLASQSRWARAARSA